MEEPKFYRHYSDLGLALFGPLLFFVFSCESAIESGFRLSNYIKFIVGGQILLSILILFYRYWVRRKFRLLRWAGICCHWVILFFCLFLFVRSLVTLEYPYPLFRFRWAILFTFLALALALFRYSQAFPVEGPEIEIRPIRMRDRSFLIIMCLVVSTFGIYLWPREPNIHGYVLGHLNFTTSDFFGVVSGQKTALVDFFPHYSNVLPHVLSSAITLMGTSVGSFTSLMALLNFIIVLSLSLLLFKNAPSPVLGFFSTACFHLSILMHLGREPVSRQYDLLTYFAVMPLRYLFPMITFYLLDRFAFRQTPSRVVLLYALAAISLLNNFDFGAICLVATLVADLFLSERALLVQWSRSRLIVVASTLVSVIGFHSVYCFLRAGQLPKWGEALKLILHYSRNLHGPVAKPIGLHWLFVIPPIVIFNLIAIEYFLSDSEASPRNRRLRSLLAFVSVFQVGTISMYFGEAWDSVLLFFLPLNVVFSFLLLFYWQSLFPKGFAPLSGMNVFRQPLVPYIFLAATAPAFVLMNSGAVFKILPEVAAMFVDSVNPPQKISNFEFQLSKQANLIRDETSPNSRVYFGCHFGQWLSLTANRLNVGPTSSLMRRLMGDVYIAEDVIRSNADVVVLTNGAVRDRGAGPLTDEALQILNNAGFHVTNSTPKLILLKRQDRF